MSILLSRNHFSTVTAFVLAALFLVAAAAAENNTSQMLSVPGPVLPVLNTTLPVTLPALNTTPALFPNTTPPTRPPRSPPPILSLNRTGIQDLTITVDGSVRSGSPGTNITGIEWDWGDGTLQEYPGFPNSHQYTAPGQYTFSVTALQSDGQVFSQEVTINVSAPVTQVPATPATTVPAGIENFTVSLLPTTIDRLNVTVNGYIGPSGPDQAVTVTIDWGDGSVVRYSDLPQAHEYGGPGTYTVSITGERSDNESVTRNISFDLNAGSGGPAPPPGEPGQPGGPLLLVALAIIAGLLVLGALIQRLISRRRARDGELPPSVAAIADRYHRSKEEGDISGAARSAEECARRLRALAEVTPERRAFFLEKAAIWETIAAGTLRELSVPEVIGPGGKAEAAITAEEAAAICSGTDVMPAVLIAVTGIAAEIAREGREGKPVGTSFVIGDTPEVLRQSRQFVLNPFHGHDESERIILDSGRRETIKEFSLLDGAFIVTGDGVVEAAGRYITVDASQVRMPGGMGSRHASIAAITMVTRSIGVVLSQSGGKITILKGGQIEKTL